jgi:hypothetical protein
MRHNHYGKEACIIGEVKAEPQGIVAMATSFGGTALSTCSQASNCPGFAEPQPPGCYWPQVQPDPNEVVSLTVKVCQTPGANINTMVTRPVR